MRWTGHVARMDAMAIYIYYEENLKGRDHLGGSRVDERIILKCV
jgi:hypothetical protein